MVDIKGLEIWWDGNGTSEQFAHRIYNQHLRSKGIVIERWNSSWLNSFSSRHGWKGKRVVDYGIGAGLLGVELLQRYDIGHYTGIDISHRSLRAADAMFKESHIGTDRYRLLHAPQTFSALGDIDIFISQAVIQHFPSQAYALDFFANLDRSRSLVLLLQFKYSSPPRFLTVDASREGFEHDSYTRRVATACMFDEKWLLRALPSYRLVWRQFQYMSSGNLKLVTWNLTGPGGTPRVAGAEELVELQLSDETKGGA